MKDKVLSCKFQSVLALKTCVEQLHPDYRHQDDGAIASHGSISLKTAEFRQSEAQSIPLRGGHHHRSSHNQGLRWYMKANHLNVGKTSSRAMLIPCKEAWIACGKQCQVRCFEFTFQWFDFDQKISWRLVQSQGAVQSHQHRLNPLSTCPDHDFVVIESNKENGDDGELSDMRESNLEPPHPNVEL